MKNWPVNYVQSLDQPAQRPLAKTISEVGSYAKLETITQTFCQLIP